MSASINELKTSPATIEEYLLWAKTYDGVSSIPDQIHRYVLTYLREKNSQMSSILHSLKDL